jgi:hypothetical protein
MGLWAMGTRRKFRTPELRFEVVFETPVLFLAPPTNKKGPIYGRQIYNIDGSDASYVETNTMKPDKERQLRISTADDELASWVALLGAFQREEADSREWEMKHRITPRTIKYRVPEYTICHSIQKMTRSYDFMPPALTKPYATTNISHLVEMTAMLGMYWKVFDEIRGNLRAEGNGYILTSTTVHGLGLVATFSVVGVSRFTENRVVPSHDIKELVFGFVPSILGISLELSNVDSVKRTFARLKWESDLFDSWQAKKDRSANMFSVTFELVGMLAIPIRIRGSNLKMLPNPTADRWPGSEIAIDWIEEMREFQALFDDAAEGVSVTGATRHPLLVTIEDQCQKMQEVWTKCIDIDMRERIHDAIDIVDQALQKPEDFSAPDISNVVASHLKAVLDATDKMQASIDANYTANSTFIKYYITEILQDVKEDGLDLSEEQKSKRGVIWWTLIFRMICWFLLHDFDKMDINMVPSNRKGSRMPVFIS